MSEGTRFGGHGSWSGFVARNGLRRSGNPLAVSGYILEGKLKKAVKENINSQVIREIIEKYNLVNISRGMDITEKIRERIDFIRLRIEKMTTTKLQEAFDIYDEQGVIPCLIFINQKRPIISQSYLGRSTRNR